MKLLAPAIPLSSKTREAWKQQGWIVLKPRTSEEMSSKLSSISKKIHIVVNYGLRNLDFPNCPSPPILINGSYLIKSISTPSALRNTVPTHLPPSLTGKSQLHWHKKPGYAGKGKYQCDKDGCEAKPGEDIQVHVDGVEYRINTAGLKIIQAHVKTPLPEGGFDWAWCGVASLKKTGVLPHLKSALKEIDGIEHSFLGWDVIRSDSGVYILEANTAPGTNAATVARFEQAISNE